MKKRTFLTLLILDFVVLCSIATVLVTSLGIDIRVILLDWKLTMRLSVTLLSLSVTIMVLLVIGWLLLDEWSKLQLNKTLRRILENKPIHFSKETEIGENVNLLSTKMRHLTENLQKTENSYIENSEVIVKQERRRIARDLHDTVSQELFASSMILSGLVHNVPQLSSQQIQEQLGLLEGIINDAQNDLRVLLLHLRPTELEGKTLSQGLEMILKELTDKANMEVIYRDEVEQLPKVIEVNLFRIAQEFISNTLKHAKASLLEVYLTQNENAVQLKMIDNGRGFDLDANRELSYGLKNMEDRVEDMAGTMTLLSAENKGVSMTIRIPLVEGSDNNGEN